ncbi:serine/threonine-protein kinase 17A-like [Monomorium pharaonis]|uniref:serine/threonine-protein kinase 17A-like n=1 Tax=Monomorium pharaonis TaxID=307658 RepID=UPI00174697F9|nr:serine/threonine-protein kinase 17A-like [Monomorium pharaonis]
MVHLFCRGKYATVRRCRERSSGRQWAAKFLRKRRRAQELRAEALHEVAVLDAAAHCSRLVSLHQVFETNTEMVLVLELAPGGELQMILDRDEVPEERQVARLLKQILDGIAFLHSLNVAHLDIKVSVFKHSNYFCTVKAGLTHHRPLFDRRCGC